jgi:hypothetical protein
VIAPRDRCNRARGNGSRRGVEGIQPDTGGIALSTRKLSGMRGVEAVARDRRGHRGRLSSRYQMRTRSAGGT